MSNRRTANQSGKRMHVIMLDSAVLGAKAFRDANPGQRRDKPCVYVGSTGLTPEERFERHKLGWKSGRFVEKVGIALRQPMTSNQPPVPWHRAEEAERRLAERLRARGYAVWQR